MARYLYICECVHQENHFCSVLFFDVKDISNVKGEMFTSTIYVFLESLILLKRDYIFPLQYKNFNVATTVYSLWN